MAATFHLVIEPWLGHPAAITNDGAKSAQLGALAFTAIGLFLLATAQLRRHDAASWISGFRAWLYRHVVVVATVMAAAVWVFAGLVVGYIWAG
jgi:hypothetical protein